MVRFRVGAFTASLAVLSAITFSVATAEDLTEDALVKALTPPKTRSLSKTALTPAQREDQAFVESLKGRTRSLSVSDRTKLQTVAADKPSANLTMEFEYNSAALQGEALKTVDLLGKALSNPDLKDKTFVLAGHTDAKGSDDINQRLSERRAAAVKKYLVDNYSLKPENLITVGYGKTQLKNPDSPFSEENRRVQTVNVLPYESAAK